MSGLSDGVSAGDDRGVRFELDRLVSYDNDALIAELQRVAALLTDGPLTRSAYDRLARSSSSTVTRRFGDWQSALAVAGLDQRYAGAAVSPRMREQTGRRFSADDVLRELRRIAEVKGETSLTQEDLRMYESPISIRTIRSRFGTWTMALEAAGLKVTALGRRWSDDDYFDNLLEVWTHYGRAPTYAQMNAAPSKITNGAYAARFGSWGQAKAAFVDRVNADVTIAEREVVSAVPVRPRVPPTSPEQRHTIAVGLRYQVLRRDRFRCVTCGRSPATDPAVTLHVDHVVPYSAGGLTRIDNLRALCQDCNLGKGRGDA